MGRAGKREDIESLDFEGGRGMETREFEKKLSLIRRIFGRHDQNGGIAMNETDTPPLRQDSLMQGLMGASIFLLGLCGALPLGVINIFTLDDGDRAVSMVLVFMGLVFCHAGAAVVQQFCPQQKVRGQTLFFVTFVASLGIVLTGLLCAFSEPGTGLYMVVIGFFSCLVAALATK